MNLKTVIAAMAAAAALVGCAEGVSTDIQCGVEGDADGMMSVRMIYDDVMTKARANREVYCVITDALGNQIVTEAVIIHLEKSN